MFNTCDWKFPSFLENSKYVNAYQELLELFIEYNSSHSENDESQLSIYPDIVSKEKVGTLLIHQPIINNVLSKNQPLKKRKYIKKIDETLLRKDYIIIGYGNLIIINMTERFYYPYDVLSKNVIVVKYPTY